MTAHVDEWERLRSERAAARAQLDRCLDALEERAKDPFRIKERIRRHPVLAASAAAAVGALLVNLLVRRREEPASTACPDGHEGSASPDLLGELREVALKAATPWIARFVEQHLDGTARWDRPAAPAEHVEATP